ncbi:hypothetical protein [Reichenbachiella ulvae]|uniref:Uncharacterized protein n=1 Tax=Reichenbachiella ulvae TaxID=2980104 RepID=A0ABT3CV54_9BACT|nr:hypothetical protein [Reichenbachiella ulvae]MCV9387118.1 hypothetical protein [Reichenbachiella ulvae]
MKRSLILIPVLLVLVGGGIYFYFHWKYSSINRWSFVPQSSIMVFQPTQWAQLLSGDEERKILKNLKSLPELKQIGESLDSLDSLVGGGFSVNRTIEANDLLISVHQGSKEALANLYILEVSALKKHDFLAQVVKYLKDVEGFSETQRVYEGYTITEFNKAGTRIAYIFYRNYLIFSFTPFLVDDAIRSLEKGKQNPYTKNLAIESTSQQTPVGEGRLYVNMPELQKFIHHFVDPVDVKGSNLELITDLIHMDLNIGNDDISFNGFSYIDTAKVNYLSSFIGVKSAGFEMKNVIPDHSGLVIHASFDDVRKWHAGLKEYWREHQPSQLTRLGEIENRYRFDVDKFYDFVGGEIGLFVLESKRNLDREKIFCIRHKDVIRAENYMEELARDSNPDTTFYHETYANRRIGEILLDELPGRIFGDVFDGFETSYYFVNRDFVFIGNTQHALEVLIDDIDTEDTWRKSIKTFNFLESTNDDANLSVYIKSAGLWSLIGQTLNSHWSQYIEEHKSVMKQLEYGVLQFTAVDNKFYTNLHISHPGKLMEAQKPQKLASQGEVNFEHVLSSKPFAVKNHNDRTLEMMVQDSSHQLSLISSTNEVVLKIPLKGQIASPIYQVDYYKNGKLQYLFATDHQVHIIDRTGTYIPGYPQKVKTSEKVKFLSLIDYDNSKNYRIMVAAEKGFYYMTNKAGKELKGWNPLKLKNEPAMGGQHLRVKTNDYMIFLQEDGIAYGLQRNAEPRKGFPIDLKASITSPLHIERGATPQTTELAAMTSNGELVVFNLLGEITRKKQLLKGSPNENFELVSSNDGENFVVVRNKEDKVEFFDEDLEPMFIIDSESQQLTYQFYSFSEDNKIIIVVDQQNSSANLYRMDGTRLNKEAIPTNQQMAMLYHEAKEEFELFVSSGRSFKRLKLKR